MRLRAWSDRHFSGLGIVDSDNDSTDIETVNPQYFHTLEVKLERGRFFDERDREDAPKVAIVNEAFARKFFLNEDPVRPRGYGVA